MVSHSVDSGMPCGRRTFGLLRAGADRCGSRAIEAGATDDGGPLRPSRGTGGEDGSKVSRGSWFSRFGGFDTESR